MMSRWTSLVPPPNVKIRADLYMRSRRPEDRHRRVPERAELAHDPSSSW